MLQAVPSSSRTVTGSTAQTVSLNSDIGFYDPKETPKFIENLLIIEFKTIESKIREQKLSSRCDSETFIFNSFLDKFNVYLHNEAQSWDHSTCENFGKLISLYIQLPPIDFAAVNKTLVSLLVHELESTKELGEKFPYQCFWKQIPLDNFFLNNHILPYNKTQLKGLRKLVRVNENEILRRELTNYDCIHNRELNFESWIQIVAPLCVENCKKEIAVELIHRFRENPELTIESAEHLGKVIQKNMCIFGWNSEMEFGEIFYRILVHEKSKKFTTEICDAIWRQIDKFYLFFHNKNYDINEMKSILDLPRVRSDQRIISAFDHYFSDTLYVPFVKTGYVKNQFTKLQFALKEYGKYLDICPDTYRYVNQFITDILVSEYPENLGIQEQLKPLLEQYSECLTTITLNNASGSVSILNERMPTLFDLIPNAKRVIGSDYITKEGIQKLKHLTELDFSESYVSDEIWEIITTLPHIEKLSLRGYSDPYKYGDDPKDIATSTRIGIHLRKMSDLKVLSLHNVTITPYLDNAIKGLKKLEHLYK